MSPTENPVTISIVGTGSPEGGGVAPTPNGTVAQTPGGQPNLRIQVITPIVAIAVRAANVFLTTGVASFTTAKAGGATDGQAFKVGLVAGGIAAGLEAVRSAITVLGRLEGKFPLLTGSI